MLNAVRHAEEATIVENAGRIGAVTVATNMAGRGTDIKLGRGVADLGGLHVLATERNESRRVDRQLYGRAGRQGDPGNAQAFVSLDDDLVRRFVPKLASMLQSRVRSTTGEISNATIRGLFAMAQKRSERMSRWQRAAVKRSDTWLDDFLGFAAGEY